MPVTSDIDPTWNPIRCLVHQDPVGQQEYLDERLIKGLVCGLWKIADNNEGSVDGAADFLIYGLIGMATQVALAELNDLREAEANRGIQLELQLD